MVPFDRTCTTFYWSAIVNIALSCTVFEISFLFAFHSNYGSIVHQFRDKARYWSQIVIFSYAPLHSVPPLGGPVGILPSSLVLEN